MSRPFIRSRRFAVRAGIVSLATMVVMAGAGPASASHCPAGPPGGLTAVLVAEGLTVAAETVRDSIPEDALTSVAFLAAAGTAGGLIAISVPLRSVYEAEQACLEDHHYENVETLLEKADQDLVLHIDHVLRDGAVPSAMLTLPASQGGYLNSTPIGIKSFVHDMYNKYIAAGIAVGGLADNRLASADAFLAQGKYKLAYRDYRQAYLMTVGVL